MLTSAQIEHTLITVGIRYHVTPEGAFNVDDRVLIYWDTNVPEDEQGWAYRVGDPYDCDSGPLEGQTDLNLLLASLH